MNALICQAILIWNIRVY